MKDVERGNYSTSANSDDIVSESEYIPSSSNGEEDSYNSDDSMKERTLLIIVPEKSNTNTNQHTEIRSIDITK